MFTACTLVAGGDECDEVVNRCDGKSSPTGRQSFWRQFRPGEAALDGQEPRTSGWSSVTGGGRRVWLKVTRDVKRFYPVIRSTGRDTKFTVYFLYVRLRLSQPSLYLLTYLLVDVGLKKLTL